MYVLQVNVGDSLISNASIVKLTKVMVDNRLSFESHLTKSRKKVRHKCHALARTLSYIF